jgi:hypothetical protein
VAPQHHARSHASTASARRLSLGLQTRVRTSSTYSTGTSSPPQRWPRGVSSIIRCMCTHSVLKKPILLHLVFLYRPDDYHWYLAEFARQQQRSRSRRIRPRISMRLARSRRRTRPTSASRSNFPFFPMTCGAAPTVCDNLRSTRLTRPSLPWHASPEHTFRNSLMILHLLRDNIILWSAEMQPDGMCALHLPFSSWFSREPRFPCRRIASRADNRQKVIDSTQHGVYDSSDSLIVYKQYSFYTLLY